MSKVKNFADDKIYMVTGTNDRIQFGSGRKQLREYEGKKVTRIFSLFPQSLTLSQTSPSFSVSVVQVF